jgi:hypothetical protein
MKGAVVVFGVVSNDNHASMLLAAALVEKAQESPSSRGVKAIVLAPKTNLPSRTCSGHLCEKFQESSRINLIQARQPNGSPRLPLI